jgi:hypothetical protein
MSDMTSSNSSGREDGESDTQRYEPPRLTPIGNMRDLLAGAEGTTDDMSGIPGSDLQSGGGG